MKSWKIYQLGGILLILSANSVLSYFNETLAKNLEVENGDTLWFSLMKNCRNPTTECIKNTTYEYLNNILETTNTYQVNSFFKFSKNNLSYPYSERPKSSTAEKRSTLEGITSDLNDKAVKFFFTHDMQIDMPEILFDGTVLQVSPRDLNENGLTTKFELLPRSLNKGVGEPRIFLKKIKKVIGEKLLNALLAISLVLSLLGIKFMFLMPLVMGVAAAKKLVLKIVLFFFPFMSHIFKLCPYYEPTGGTKLHHHQHHIAHLHHIPPHHGPHHHGPPIHGGPHGHFHESPHLVYPDSAPPDVGVEYYADGPEITNEIVNHRKTDGSEIIGDENQIHSWATLGQGQNRIRPQQVNKPLTSAEIENLALIAEKEAVLKVRLQQEHQKVQAQNKLLHEQIKQGLKLQEKLKLQALLVQQRRRIEQVQMQQAVLSGGLRAPPPAGPVGPLAIPVQTGSAPVPIAGVVAGPVTSYTRALTESDQNSGSNFVPSYSPAAVQSNEIVPSSHKTESFQTESHGAAAVTEISSYDGFYSPILEKIDGILAGIGFKEEACKERLICSMYKNPTKFSPHSNFLSTQLSRDSSELQKPTSTNAAVIRFYRYVQAARDGQDKRECLRLYPACSINTEI